MDLKSFADIVMKHVREYVQPAVTDLVDRIDALGKRVGELEGAPSAQRSVSASDLADAVNALATRIELLEQRKGFAYRGIWDQSETYEPDEFVTHGGSMWHTDEPTQSRPGSPGSPWQLCVKRGRDSR